MDDRPPVAAGEHHKADGPSARDARRDELRPAVKRGLEEMEEGRVLDLEQAFDRIEAMLDELEATGRAWRSAAGAARPPISATIATNPPRPRHYPVAERA
jgi:hypothetical protein